MSELKNANPKTVELKDLKRYDEFFSFSRFSFFKVILITLDGITTLNLKKGGVETFKRDSTEVKLIKIDWKSTKIIFKNG